MMEKIKTRIAICTILLLFPYIVVMLTGNGAEAKYENRNQAETGMLEQWVLEILPGQMPVTYEEEALKAQAIVIRSNLIYWMEQDHVEIPQLTEEHIKEWGMTRYSYAELQELLGGEAIDLHYEKIHRAVEETCGKVLQFEGRYVDIPYHAVSGGITRSGELLGETYAYLEAVDCPGELEAENFLTTVERFLDEPEIIARDAFGYVTEIREGGELLGGEEFRQKYGLPSSNFELVRRDEEGKWLVAAKGLGHGFGMSLYQAQRMAEAGADCPEILSCFYEKLTLSNLVEK